MNSRRVLRSADGYYDSVASGYDRQRFQTKYARIVSDREIDFVLRSVQPGERVLEFGCGTGRFTRALADKGCSVTAIDSSREMLEATRQLVGANNEVRLIHGKVQDASRLVGGRFDAVVSMRMLPHVSEKRDVLAVMSGFGEAHASYVVDSWNLTSFVGLSRWILRRKPVVESYYLRRSEFLELIANSGFDVVAELCWGYPRIGEYSLDSIGEAYAKTLAYSTVVRMVANNGD